MISLRLAKKNKEVNAQSWETLYSHLIEKKIRERYSISAELAILRQRDTKPDEFRTYFDYVEECKAAVKKEMGV